MDTEQFMKRLLIVALILIVIAISGDMLQALVDLVFDNGL
jgi:hypothetical protein